MTFDEGDLRALRPLNGGAFTLLPVDDSARRRRVSERSADAERVA